MAHISEDSLALKQLIVEKTEIVAGRTGRNAYFSALTNVKLGGWFNAAKAQLHFGSAGTGEITGFGSAFNAELYLPNKTMAGGSYTGLEVNLNFQASTVCHANPALPISMAHFKVGGTQAQIDDWEDKGSSCALSFQGLTSGAGSVFDATQAPAAANASLKINISGTAYWIMLSTTAS